MLRSVLTAERKGALPAFLTWVRSPLLNFSSLNNKTSPISKYPQGKKILSFYSENEFPRGVK